MKEIRAYTPQDVIDDDTLHAKTKAIESEHLAVFEAIHELERKDPVGWFDIACDTFGAQSVLDYIHGIKP